jgi:hypothetical protein
MGSGAWTSGRGRLLSLALAACTAALMACMVFRQGWGLGQGAGAVRGDAGARGAAGRVDLLRAHGRLPNMQQPLAGRAEVSGTDGGCRLLPNAHQGSLLGA